MSKTSSRGARSTLMREEGRIVLKDVRLLSAIFFFLMFRHIAKPRADSIV